MCSSRDGKGYLSYTTSLQLRTTVIPDTVAIVAWTVDTNLKPGEQEQVTPNVSRQGRGAAAAPVARGLLLALGTYWVHAPNALSRLCPAPSGEGRGCARPRHRDTAGRGCPGLVPPTPEPQRVQRESCTGASPHRQREPKGSLLPSQCSA